ncbi:hypothetical protein L7F22_057923 [Adiantum nelumboides]|nr:hypothetical protein [Adiantum nelumboides]
MSEDTDLIAVYSQYTQSPYSPPLVHGSFPLSPFGGSPFGFRPFQPTKTTSQQIARQSPLPFQPHGEASATQVEGATTPSIDAAQPTLTKLPAKKRIARLNSEITSKGNATKGRMKAQVSLEDTTKEKKGRENWKDAWMVQLIHICGAMHAEFGKTPKQGIDLWSKVATQLASLFPDCDKDGQACRKKWGRVYNSYKTDKSHLSISGNDRIITCDWYDIVDEYMHGRANVVCGSHASALGSKTDKEMDDASQPLEGQSQDHVAEEGEDATQASATKEKSPSTIPTRSPHHKKDRKIEDSLTDMANTAKLMASQQRESDTDHKATETQRLQLLGALTNAVAGLMDVVKNFTKS